MQRHPSLTQAAVMELLNHPSNAKSPDPQFAGRDWRQIRVGELVNPEDIRMVTPDTNVEEATKVGKIFLYCCTATVSRIRAKYAVPDIPADGLLAARGIWPP